MDDKVKALLAEHPSLSVLDNGKVRCSLTNHECPARLDTIQQYINGGKYRKVKDWYSHDFSKYEPYLVASRNNPKRLYCNVTRGEVNKIPREVEIHINSGRYKVALEKFERRRQRALRIEQGLPVTDSEESDLSDLEDDAGSDADHDETQFKRKKEVLDSDEKDNDDEEMKVEAEKGRSDGETRSPKRKMRKI